MSTLGWVLLGGLAPIPYTWRRLFRVMCGEWGDLTWADVGYAAFFSLFFSLGWPYFFLQRALTTILGTRDPMVFVRRVAGEERKEKLARLEREAKEREEHVHELEQELKIGRYLS